MIPRYNFLKTYKMDGNDIIAYLKNVYDDANTGGNNGYLDSFLQNHDEIIGRIQGFSGKKHYIANDLLEKINDSMHNNFNDSELEDMLN